MFMLLVKLMAAFHTAAFCSIGTSKVKTHESVLLLALSLIRCLLIQSFFFSCKNIVKTQV